MNTATARDETSLPKEDALPTGNVAKVGRVRYTLGQYAIQWIMLISIVLLSLANPNFRQPSNIANILLQASFAGIAAAGMTLLIVAGAFDLSVAGLLALCGIGIVELMPQFGLVAAILVALALGLLLGAVNGLVVTKLRIPAFIATLGMMYIYLAVGFIWAGSVAVPVTDSAFLNLGTGTIGPVPTPFVVMIAVYLAAHGILRFTRYGRYTRAIGSNPTAARVAGLPVDRILILAFVFVGLCTAISGILLTALLSSAMAIMAQGFELNVIAVVVVGGTSLNGGQGTLFGSFTGALLFAAINNALNIFGVGAYWQYVAVGSILIVALAIGGLRKRLLGMARA